MKQRIVTGVIAAAGFVAIALAGGWFYAGLLVLMAIVGFYEYVRMNGMDWRHPASIIGFAAMLMLALPWQLIGWDQPSALAVLWIEALLLLSVTVIAKNKITIDSVALMLLGSLYVGYGFGALNAVRQLEENGMFWTFMLLGCIIASDVGAYFVGRAIGRNKLWPSISPNKTIEGAVGGILLSLVTAICFAIAAPDKIEIAIALVIGLIAAVAGQMGDLIQSAYKRVRDIKDTGAILPGHGGILDRCDSWIIVFPLVVLSGLLPT
ncbi:phosphatidate cytidylyltransferase [Paenibacillus sp. NEAU-GSW1]|uniref:phosphatidate cytidylyltransferase n=1 Tax=Paenibacillus sp. NEAU-GSW1 TaxID=2682486 RepID=UPI0012E2F61C|nr:phosphatidate cytidylyltransferase [Paenibacillus sp. NEAU-GSW1]MUT66389.1 phosphatidate cytidylyltransferase [Paenibacillus sp. NEAU-GSW1]